MDITSLPQELQNFCQEMKFQKLTDIQAQAYPVIMGKSHFLAQAPTGTGKTLAYAMAVMKKIKEIEGEFKSRPQASPLAVIIAPTRELSQQIHNQFKALSHHLKLRVRFATGGKENNEYGKLMNSDFEILIATPNFLKMSISRGDLSLRQLQFCILDEADQMFDMGFAKELGVVFAKMDKNTCALGLVSATMSDAILDYIKEKFSDIQFKKVIIGREKLVSSKIESFSIHSSEKDKTRLLATLLKRNIHGRGIIFCNNFERVKTVCEYLLKDNPKLKIRQLHGKLDGAEREKTHKAFSEGKFQILVATDIAARGIDIQDLAWVVNFELPQSVIYYVHRCGRVARGNKVGVVYNFVSAVDEKRIIKINEVIREQGNIEIDLIKIKKPKAQIEVKEKGVKPTKRNNYQEKVTVVKKVGGKAGKMKPQKNFGKSRHASGGKTARKRRF